MASTRTGTRLTAEERREEVLQAATEEFARGGLDGTPTEAIARRVGISQPYLFRLFRTKKELFLAVIARCFDLTLSTFREAAGERSGTDALHAMGRSYAGILGPLAFATIVARGVVTGSGVEGTLAAASAALFLFAAIGYIVGQLGEVLVNESVRKQFQVAMAAWDEKQQQQAKSQPKPTT